MAEEGGQEKTEAPTQKKREDARKEGRVSMSKEIPSAALLGTFLLYFLVAGKISLEQVEKFWVTGFQHIIAPDLTIQSVYYGLRTSMMSAALMVGGLFMLILLVSLLSSVVQVGVQFTGLKFQGNRLSPFQGMKRIFSYNGLAELFKGLFKMAVIGYITYVSIEGVIEELLSLGKMPLGGIFTFNIDLITSLFGRVTVALVVLAIFDYLFQRWNFEQNLKMTKQELKEEMKQTEGDPQLRSRVRAIQRETSRARMMQNVPKADVVVTNPTHFAVALEYDREVMTAPRVTAKGADFIAERIKEIARENDVPIVENPPLAREIYRLVDIGQEVPEEFFRTVAEILAYVYRLKGKTAEPSSAGALEDEPGTEDNSGEIAGENTEGPTAP